MADALAAGDLVTAEFMPSLGVGLVQWVAADRLLVSFEVDGRPFIDEFSPGELRRAKPKIARTA